MRTKILLFVIALASTALCLEIKIELDSDSILYPQWISGTIKIHNNESRSKDISMETSQPDIFLTQDTTVKLLKVTDFGPNSPVTLEPGVSAMWCFMSDMPERYIKSKPIGPHKISLTIRQFGAEAKSKPYTLWVPSTVSDKDLELTSMKNLVSQLSTEEVIALNEATNRFSFSKRSNGQIDPRILFWKYRLRHAAFMKDLRQMPICENCFHMPTSLYWSNLLWDWCRMFEWNTPRCAENEIRIQKLLASSLGQLEGELSNTSPNQIVHTKFGKFVVSHRQAKMLKGGGIWK